MQLRAESVHAFNIKLYRWLPKCNKECQITTNDCQEILNTVKQHMNVELYEKYLFERRERPHQSCKSNLFIIWKLKLLKSYKSVRIHEDIVRMLKNNETVTKNAPAELLRDIFFVFVSLVFFYLLVVRNQSQYRRPGQASSALFSHNEWLETYLVDGANFHKKNRKQHSSFFLGVKMMWFFHWL